MDNRQIQRVIERDIRDVISEYESLPNDDVTRAALKKELDELLKDLHKSLTTKTDGQGRMIIVDNPDYASEDGSFRKHRKKNTGYTPPKKKRKKNKKTHRR